MKKEFRTQPRAGLSAVIPVTLIFILGWSPIYSATRSMDFPGFLTEKNFVIYGDDNRKDYYEVQNDEWKERMESSAVLVPTGYIKTRTDGRYELDAPTLMEQIVPTGAGDFPICPTERFVEQKSIGFCSGTLVGPQTIITAGHCVNGLGPMDGGLALGAAVIFGQNIKEKGLADSGPINLDQIYFVAEIVAMGSGRLESDFAILKLNKPVTVARPMPVEKNSTLHTGSELTLIGSPSGLPVKLADNGRVRKLNVTTIEATTDSYAGNSGSAVYNSITGRIEGILVAGEDDYELNIGAGNACAMSKRCKETECSGESITKISVVLPHLKGLI